ncbi:DUF3667 domain-containing protein [Pedobacter frigidisoli]|uniref:DUF3667 domain-containing protein n=1 Tax=Pedobacter frigidisoli TaxID=2530455 RepID=A0A4R0P251_9SPHI|nr:DUF3667 domain-containing protein [Pedobacter frigidisoli]TCD07056.1 DUF3667 domain-containing protein [Pedobacter frigidisoli]
MQVNHCSNCNALNREEDRYCSKCGQEAHVHRFTLAHIFHEFFHAFTHADKGIFFLLKELLIRPGVVAMEYVNGKRKKYFSPFTFFLILAGLFVLSNTFFRPTDAHQKVEIPANIQSIQDPVKKAESVQMFGRAMKAKYFTAKYGNVIAMIAVPFFALFFWLIYFKKQYNYAEHFVANILFVSFSNLAFTLLVFPLEALAKNTPWIAIIPLIGLITQVVYYTYAYKGFMQIKGFFGGAKVFLQSLIGIVIWVMLSMTFMAIYIYQNIHFLDFFKRM